MKGDVSVCAEGLRREGSWDQKGRVVVQTPSSLYHSPYGLTARGGSSTLRPKSGAGTLANRMLFILSVGLDSWETKRRCAVMYVSSM
jgi:hypothetical protein